MSFIATVFQWVFYGLGLIFTILLLFSILMKPILFNKEWKALIFYGLYAIIYFTLWFHMFNSQDVATYINNTLTSTDTVKTSSASNQGANNNSSNTSNSNQTSNKSEVNANTAAANTNAVNETVAKSTTQTQSTTNNKTSNESTKQYVDSNGKGTIIGDTDSKIYHVPGSTYYNREMQKTSNNIYFKTTAEAEAAGYRAPKR